MENTVNLRILPKSVHQIQFQIGSFIVWETNILNIHRHPLIIFGRT
jgi:hypothetical protein